jgi:hypothetical protein
MAAASALVTLIAAGPSGAQQRTILDYYLALPAEYFTCENSPKVTREYREKQIVRKNVPSGYIEAKSEGHKMEVALFTDRKADVNVVAVSIRCGAGCMCNRFALLRADGAMKWTEATSALFPGESEILGAVEKGDYVLEYILPEFGTVITVADAFTGKTLVNVDWKGGRFVILPR